MTIRTVITHPGAISGTRKIVDRMEDVSCRLEGVASALSWLAMAEEGDTDEPDPRHKANTFRMLRGIAEDCRAQLNDMAGTLTRDRRDTAASA